MNQQEETQLIQGRELIEKVLSESPSNADLSNNLLVYRDVFHQMFFSGTEIKPIYLNTIATQMNTLQRSIAALKVISYSYGASHSGELSMVSSHYGDMMCVDIRTALGDIKNTLCETLRNNTSNDDTVSQNISIVSIDAPTTIAIGNNNSQTVIIASNYDAKVVYKEIVLKLTENVLSNEIPISCISGIDEEIKDLSEELAPSRQEKSRLQSILLKMKEKAMDIPIDILKESVVNAVTSSSGIELLQEVFSLL